MSINISTYIDKEKSAGIEISSLLLDKYAVIHAPEKLFPEYNLLSGYGS